MNRLMSQQQKVSTTTTSTSTGTITTNLSSLHSTSSSESIHPPMSTESIRPMLNLQRARSPSQDSVKRSNSPRIAQQTLSPSVSRKPVEVNRDRNNSTDSASEQNKYKFDETPMPSARNSNIDLQMDPQVKLEDYDWAELEDQFAKRMEAFRAEEDGIWAEWKGWGEIFKAWASTISVHDEERASKRLRTRIAFTQGSEESLEAKRQHYIKVVQAFESALALLSSRTSAHNFI